MEKNDIILEAVVKEVADRLCHYTYVTAKKYFTRGYVSGVHDGPDDNSYLNDPEAMDNFFRDLYVADNGIDEADSAINVIEGLLEIVSVAAGHPFSFPEKTVFLMDGEVPF